jgi:plasmid stability protein
MPDLLITDLDEALLRAIRSRAEATGKPVADKARELLELGLRLDREGRLAEAARSRSLTPPGGARDSTSVIRRIRDAG